ncbi:flavodoxin domain-containing protein [Clostridium estertheticum]|uniref:flavodoxin domain-containing protein n=1 Tax=Clostridium estertheticum TaxID=238834 RepID=UPI001C0AFB97|nr:flavodoxin domain-containing protein [Clostridium estertheticum]MBU3073905.1 flavodoxin domain-containing protein [Clostridium estertheticum]MBU3164000.1 flavodoxin domain-containing protein [Clostridium estertheticum]
MKTVVIYKSKTGFTKKYAEWISEALSADIFDISRVDINVVTNYDTVIYGGSLYAVGIIGVKCITKNLDKFKGKKVVVFATGASPSSEEVIREVKDKNFTPEDQKSVQFFYLRGGFDYSKIKPFDKALMTLLKWKIKMKKELTPEARGMLAMYDKPVDFTRRKNIDEIITYVNS